ncbi:MAG: 6-pyruvoyl-tetrahydropterin synthase-related protein [Syntrophales bacterium]|jgi:tetratricopeptide (TPR) repeat protein|nr:6-pyruvoyl-tetrahydropterin synthase-related protein [Syntrophales bacterium]
MQNKKYEILIDILVHLGIFFFLLSFFRPEYLLSGTIITGGDTGSHYYTAEYLKEVLLPQGKISGWTMGNYAGFPILQFYFPFPFLIMVALSFVMPLQVAFKLVSVLGIFTLPLAVYAALRLLNQRFPVPAAGALFTLFFLFMDANSMWGGNITSTLAGEFAYSIGMSLTILFAGTLYRGITTNRYAIANGILVFLIGFSHGYTLLFAGFMSSFFLFDWRNFLKNFVYLCKVHGLAFILLGFWLIPLIASTPWTTAFSDRWFIKSILEVLPPILWPGIILTVLGAVAVLIKIVLSRRNVNPGSAGRAGNVNPSPIYLGYGMAVACLFYLIGPSIHVIDIRFLPFLQLYFMMTGAVALGYLIRPLRGKIAVPVILFLLVIPGVNHFEKKIHTWIPWNYNGFETKRLWKPFIETNRYLAGSEADPRVIYEHATIHNGAGTIRAFESIPLFSGRNTLEGLYLQACVSSPFVFYIQGEMSKQSSRPFSQYQYSDVNITEGIEHLKLFNVRDFIVASDEIREELKKHPEFTLEKEIPPYSIYRLATSQNRYVVPLAYAPAWNDRREWKQKSYQWFRDYSDHPGIHLIFDDGLPPRGLPAAACAGYEKGRALPALPITEKPIVTEKVTHEEIRITTTKPGVPLLIKVSYHPGWRVEGADKIYLASPSFMLVYPKENDVRLYYGGTLWDRIGAILSILGIICIAAGIFFSRKGSTARTIRSRIEESAAARPAKALAALVNRRQKVIVVALAVFVCAASAWLIVKTGDDPRVLHNKAIKLRDKDRLQDAREIFYRILSAYPDYPKADEAYYYYAICYWKDHNWEKTIEVFEKLTATYPESPWVPEALFHIGKAHVFLKNQKKANEYFDQVIRNHPTSRWVKYSKEWKK